MLKFSISIYPILLFSASLAFAGPTACPQFYVDGVAPDFINPKLSQKTRELCNEGFAVQHSGLTRTPLYTAEVVTRDGLQWAKELPRNDAFRADHRLPVTERSELTDYARSGMDRGHVFAAADAMTARSKDESFLLSNMVPQNSDNNRGLWSDIEATVRKEAKRRGKLYVLTGPLYQGSQVKALKGRVLIPTGLYKAVLDPVRKEAAAYVVANAPGTEYQVVSISELEKMAGISLFPTLPSQVKNRAMLLPAPTKKRR